MLALVTDAFGGRGGIAQYNRDFLSAFASAGSKVVVLPRLAPDEEKPPNGIEQRTARFGRFSYSRAVISESFRFKPDVVFCGHIYMAPLGWIAAKFAGAKLVIQTHGIDAWRCPSTLARKACEQATMILSVSRYTRDRVIEWAAIPSGRVVMIPNTVGDCFTPGDGKALRREWSLDGKKVLLTVGRMPSKERCKGQDRVIEALPALIAAGHDVVYIVSGEGTDRLRLERLAHEVRVSDRVRFVGALSRKRLIEAYRMADLFVMPSTTEGFGIVFLEAMACGTPVMGLDADGSRDALANGELGTFADPNDLAGSISKALLRPKPNPDALYAAVQARFGHASFQAHVISTFTELLKSA